MRVVHFGFADDLPGASRASYRLHRTLLDLDVDSRMVVARKLTDDPTVLGPAPGAGALRARAAVALDHRGLRLLAQGRNEVSFALTDSGMLHRVHQEAPDVVTLHWVAGGLVRPERLRHLPDRPVVWRLADMWPFAGTAHYAGRDRGFVTGYAEGPSRDRRLWKRKHRGVSRIRDLTLVAPSRWMASCAEQSAMFQERRVEIIATGTDTDTFAPRPVAQVRAELGLPGGTPLVLFGAVGSGTNLRKGGAELRAALRHVAAAHPERAPELVVFGSAGDDLRDTGLRVHALGSIDDQRRLASAYAAADVFIAPSLEENLANTVLESLACGTPVVAFDIGGMPDAIDHGRNGWLAAAGDTVGLAAGIRWVLEARTDVAASTRAAARATAVERFDMRTQAARWKALYDDVDDSWASRRGV